MILELLLMIVGLVLLVGGSDKFVESGSGIAKRLGVSDFIIGLTLIAVGTSIPELASSIAAALKGSSGLIVGNLVGSNIANIGLIVGISALIASIKTDETMLKRDGYILLFVSIIFTLLAIRGVIDYIEGLVLLIVYFIYVLFLIETQAVIKQKFHFKEFVGYLLKFKFIGTLLNHSKRNSGIFEEAYRHILEKVRKRVPYSKIRVIDTTTSVVAKNLFSLWKMDDNRGAIKIGVEYDPFWQLPDQFPFLIFLLRLHRHLIAKPSRPWPCQLPFVC